LKDHLARQGFSGAEMIAAGMVVNGEDIPVPYDRFRHRIMFPITDLKGRVIAFGGRALDSDAPAKYLNSPETPLFRKGAVLYNVHNARTAAHDKGRVIVVEGYMDVIALSQAAFRETVAPLGTALTEEQLNLLWRMAPEPVLCFDGDPAGRRAAFRAIEIALPSLRPGFSVQFAFLPEGLDPDDLARQRGTAGISSVLAGVRPLVDVLWEREMAASPVDTPERRAVFERRLEQLIARIREPKVQALYRRDIKDRLWRTWRNAGPQAKPARPARTVSETWSGETLLLAIIAHPWLLDEFTDEIAAFELASDVHARLLAYILRLHAERQDLDASALLAALGQSEFGPLCEHLRRYSAHKGLSFVNSGSSRQVVHRQFSVFLSSARRRVLAAENDRLKVLLEQNPTEELLARHAQLRQEIDTNHAAALSFPDESERERQDFDRFLSSLLAPGRPQAT
jgi:DNA primase